MKWLEAVTYTFAGFLITEAAVWIPVWTFDAMADRWKQYLIRQPTAYERAVMAKVRVKETERRFSKYKTEWLIYLFTWTLSSMDFQDDPPTHITAIGQIAGLIFLLDVWIWFAHWWLHSRNKTWGGHEVHLQHHSYRFVGCWYVDHESGLESVTIGVVKHGLLAYFSPHPYIAFIYLFYAKLWNVLAHCGHRLPVFDFIDKYLPFIGTPNQHELHHFHHLDGNYAVFTTVLDRLAGTHAVDDEASVKFGHGIITHDTVKDDESPEKNKKNKRRLRYPRDSLQMLTAEQEKKIRAACAVAAA